MDELKTLEVKRQIDGINLSATVSPASWMYTDYGLQIAVRMENGGVAYLRRESLRFADATEADIRTLLNEVHLVACQICGKPAFDPASVSTNRAGQCEACFMTALNAEFSAAQEKENRRLAKLDAKRKQEGYTHRVDAWVHPSAGGDDYLVNVWMINPTDDDIRAFLRRKRSRVLDDYRVILL